MRNWSFQGFVDEVLSAALGSLQNWAKIMLHGESQGFTILKILQLCDQVVIGL